MRKRNQKKHITIDAFEADIDSNYTIWKNETQQREYLGKIASQIGWIIIEFNKLEWQLNEVLKQYFCNDIPELSALYYDLIASRNFASKVELLKKFYKLYGNGTKKNVFTDTEDLLDWDNQVDTLIKKLKEASELRNKYAHCFWHRLDENKFVEFKSVMDTKLGMNNILIKFDEQDLIEDFETISNLTIDLFNVDSVFNDAFSNS